jgi:hypothetical protein
MNFHQARIIRFATKSQTASHQSFGLLSIGPLLRTAQFIDKNGVAISAKPKIVTIMGGPKIRPTIKPTWRSTEPLVGIV